MPTSKPLTVLRKRTASAPPVFSLVKIWDFGTKKEIAVHSMLGNATALTVSRQGDLCAVASLPQTAPPLMSCGPPPAQSPDQPPVIHVFSPASGKALTTFHGHADRVSCLAFSPEGERLASAGNDGVVRVWSLQSIADQRK